MRRLGEYAEANKERVHIREIGYDRSASLYQIALELCNLPGLQSENGEIREQGNWDLVMEVSLFPQVKPSVSIGPNAYAAHVGHRDYIPDSVLERARLLPELQAMISDPQLHGTLCYIRNDQYSLDIHHLNLATILFQASRIICGAEICGEQAALNFHARDHFLRLKEEGKLPLGPPLPHPNTGRQETPGKNETGPRTSNTNSKPILVWK